MCLTSSKNAELESRDIETYQDLMDFIKQRLVKKSTKRITIELCDKPFDKLLKLVIFYTKSEVIFSNDIKVFSVDINSRATIIKRVK